jgi:hypothetical protein
MPKNIMKYRTIKNPPKEGDNVSLKEAIKSAKLLKLKNQIISWINSKKITEFTPKDLVKINEFKSFSVVEIADALASLISDNILHQSYILKLPNGNLSTQIFADPRDIPEPYIEKDQVYPTASLDIDILFTVNILYKRG